MNQETEVDALKRKVTGLRRHLREMEDAQGRKIKRQADHKRREKARHNRKLRRQNLKKILNETKPLYIVRDNNWNMEKNSGVGVNFGDSRVTAGEAPTTELLERPLRQEPHVNIMFDHYCDELTEEIILETFSKIITKSNISAEIVTKWQQSEKTLASVVQLWDCLGEVIGDFVSKGSLNYWASAKLIPSHEIRNLVELVKKHNGDDGETFAEIILNRQKYFYDAIMQKELATVGKKRNRADGLWHFPFE